MENLKIKEGETTLASLDIENMYPSVRLSLIRKAVTFYSTGVKENISKTIEECWKMIEFGMQSCLIIFDGRYYEYSIGEEKLDKELVIS